MALSRQISYSTLRDPLENITPIESPKNFYKSFGEKSPTNNEDRLLK